MKAQQLLDLFIIPTLGYMGGGYDSLDARMLMLVTSAPESNCGHVVVQGGGGPALGIWQMEPETLHSIYANCDALRDKYFLNRVNALKGPKVIKTIDDSELISSPSFACAMARLKYAMDIKSLPSYTDKYGLFEYYKRIYNTEAGATTWDKFRIAWDMNGISKVKLS